MEASASSFRHLSGAAASTSGRSTACIPLYLSERRHFQVQSPRRLPSPSKTGKENTFSSTCGGLMPFQPYRLFSSPLEVAASVCRDHEPDQAIEAIKPEDSIRQADDAAVIEGVVHRIHYRSLDTLYTVMSIALRNPTVSKRPRKRLVTAVGNFWQLDVGQSVRIHGEWTTHPQYGRRLKAKSYEELRPEESGDMMAFLSGGAVPGVGPVIAKKLVDYFGNGVRDMLDSPDAVEQMINGPGMSKSRAIKIKQGWNNGRDAREGFAFLSRLGIPAPIAKRVYDSLGPRASEIISKDPYIALGGFGLSISRMDKVADAVGVPKNRLVSRVASAMRRCLVMSAESEGHTHLPWNRLESETRRLLEDLNMTSQHSNINQSLEAPLVRAAPLDIKDEILLQLTAQHMHETNCLVIETSNNSINGEQFNSTSTTPPGDGVLHSAQQVKARLSTISDRQIQSMASVHGSSLVAVLSQPTADAIRALMRCKGIGPKTAEKIKAQWDAGDTTAALEDGRLGLLLDDLRDTNVQVQSNHWGPDVKCYLPEMHAAETAIARAITDKAAAAVPSTETRRSVVRSWIQSISGNGVELSQGQCDAIEAAADAPILVITGGPGCGKTTVLQYIVKLWAEQDGKKVHLCAPTGRAAQRMGSFLGYQPPNAVEPCTVHRLLRYQPRRAALPGAGFPKDGPSSDEVLDSTSSSGSLEEGGYFELGPSNLLQSDAVLVDEASMLSIPLASALMQALAPETQLVLVGDTDQLPPIGPGGALQSLISSGLVPIFDLREVFRHAAQSDIVKSALAVRQGQIPLLTPAAPSADALLHGATDALVVRAPHPEAVPDLVYVTVEALVSSGKVSEPELQVITPMRRGATGSGSLNLRLQRLLNPPHPGKAEVIRIQGQGRNGGGEDFVFRVGDRVLQLTNNYEKDVFNGDQGYVVHASAEQRRIVVNFPRTAQTSSAYEGYHQYHQCVYEAAELSQLDLAYAVTVHKAQGGEARYVIFALSPAHGRLLTRHLLYTGLTRAKDLLVVVAPGGQGDPLPLAVARSGAANTMAVGSLCSRIRREGLLRGCKVQEGFHIGEAF
jgi:ATP-dependent exoDNAse (exonuclease V) alpha subunit